MVVLSRQILGMANRVPGLARQNCGGYGYVLVGVARAAMCGTDRLDPAQLHDGINPYVDATGPAWRARYIQVNNAAILAIEVEPRSGDSIHTLKKTYKKFARGGRSSSGRTARPTPRSPKTSRTSSNECRVPSST